MPRPLALQSAIGLLIAAATHAVAGGLPTIPLHASHQSSAPGVDALTDGFTGLDRPAVREHGLLLTLLSRDSDQTDPEAQAEASRLHQSDQTADVLDTPFYSVRFAAMTYSATTLGSLDRGPMLDAADLTPRSLNIERFAPTKPTLAFFIPSVGTGTLLSAGLLVGIRRKR